jgi:predicted dienelactone hydrolase
VLVDFPADPVQRVLVDDSRPDLKDPHQGRPVRIYDWAPRTPDHAPLVIVSHGTGGSGRDMGWLAGPLVAAGLRVLSLDHHGNNYVDGYHPEGFLFGWERPRDVSFVLDAIGRPGDPVRVGVAGFSLGGYTAAALTGARLDPAVIEAILTGSAPVPPIEEFPEALDILRGRLSGSVLVDLVRRASADLRDSRLNAAFLISPGLGGLVTTASLGAIRVPVAICWGDADETNPFDRDVRPFLEHIPGARGEQVRPDVTHHDFIEPLTPHRNTVRNRVAAHATRFFVEKLRPAVGG